MTKPTDNKQDSKFTAYLFYHIKYDLKLQILINKPDELCLRLKALNMYMYLRIHVYLGNHKFLCVPFLPLFSHIILFLLTP